MRVLGGERAGEAIDLRDSGVDPERLVAAVGDPEDDLVECPPPGPVHEYAGHVHPGMSLSVRAAVAAAARSRGASAPQDERLAAAEEELAATPTPSVDLADARRRVAEARETEAGLRERVARLSGRVEALRESGADAEAAERELAAAGRELADAETDRVAAEQALARARSEAREVRDARERRLELTDRVENLRRGARDHLAASHYDAFGAAVRGVPGEADPGEGPGEYEGDAVTAALAVVRMADLEAPAVLSCDRFASARAARDCLDAPVLRV